MRPVAGQETNTPIYRVEVVERTVQAVSYQYRTGSTKIDFRGTVLLTAARGEAEVESRQGRTEVEAKFQNLAPPARFGREYLTYVLWAVTPEGRPHNLGEIVPDSSDNGRLGATTDLQAFGLIVTAEPYAAVRQPSDVVVLENQVRSDTAGKVRAIQVKYELMPRGHYTWQVPASLQSAVTSVRSKVSRDRYEALLALYQAQNALGIARTSSADRYAADTFARAQLFLDQAQELQDTGAGDRRVVQSARETAQTAEDARAIAHRRQHEEKLTAALAEAAAARDAKLQAELEAQQAKAEAEAARAALAQAEAEIAAAGEREVRAEAAEAEAAPAKAVPAPSWQQEDRNDVQKSGLRGRLLQQLNGVLATQDTPRGLVATIPDGGFSGPVLRRTAWDQVLRLSTILASQPGLRAEVQGHSDNTGNEPLSWRRAQAVRDALVQGGLRADAVSARGLGDSRPLVAHADGREENRRVEIVISGDPIGTLPYWDRAYALVPR
jgi:outer membrane protein OmpA-like peptidoglycan-associated protein